MTADPLVIPPAHHTPDGLPVPETIKEFNALIPNEDAARDYLGRVRWPDGFTCPRCGANKGATLKTRGLIACSKGHQISVTSGTAMHRTKLPLWDWLYAAFLISTQTPGVSALQLQRQIGHNSHEPIFLMLHKIRNALVDPSRSRLSGEVEVNEFFVGGPEVGHPGRGAVAKQLCAIAVEVRRRTDADGTERSRAGRVRLATIPDARTATLVPWIQANVAEGSVVSTDGWAAYRSLSTHGYDHRPDASVEAPPTAHLIVSNLKAWLLGTYHGAVRPKHLQAYFNEYAFRFNRRFWRGPAFLRCLRLILAVDDPLEYDALYTPGVVHTGDVRGAK